MALSSAAVPQFRVGPQRYDTTIQIICSARRSHTDLHIRVQPFRWPCRLSFVPAAIRTGSAVDGFGQASDTGTVRQGAASLRGCPIGSRRVCRKRHEWSSHSYVLYEVRLSRSSLGIHVQVVWRGRCRLQITVAGIRKGDEQMVLHIKLRRRPNYWPALDAGTGILSQFGRQRPGASEAGY